MTGCCTCHAADKRALTVAAAFRLQIKDIFLANDHNAHVDAIIKGRDYYRRNQRSQS